MRKEIQTENENYDVSDFSSKMCLTVDRCISMKHFVLFSNLHHLWKN